MSRFFAVALTCFALALAFEASTTIKKTVVDLALQKKTEQLRQVVIDRFGSNDMSLDDEREIDDFEAILDSALELGSRDPNHLYNIADSLLTSSYLKQDGEEISHRLVQAKQSIEQSIVLRPSYPDSYALLAYIQNDLSVRTDSLLASLRRAHKFGPYEKNTLISGMELYLDHWDSISSDDKIRTTNYILHPNRYGLTNRERDELLSIIDPDRRACRLLHFYEQETTAC